MSVGLKLPVSRAYEPIDPDGLAKNWIQGPIGTQRRQTNRAAYLQQLAQQINCLAARCPRVLFANWSESGQWGGTSVQYKWMWPDRHPNAREQEYRVLSALRVVDPGTGAGQWKRTDDVDAADAYTVGGQYPDVAPLFDSKAHLIEEAATYERGAEADADDIEGIRSLNDHIIHGLVVQEAAYDALDFTDQWYVGATAKAGEPVAQGITERMRQVLHETRRYNVPIVLSWAASAYGAGYSTSMSANTADALGIRIDDTSYRNVLDCTTASATFGANTPGWQAHQYLCGVGDPATARGSNIKVVCRVFGQATTVDGTVRFETPQGNVEISIPVAGGLDWYGDDDDYVSLDSTVGNDDVTAARNKIDVCAKAGASGSTFVYGLRAWILYE